MAASQPKIEEKLRKKTSGNQKSNFVKLMENNPHHREFVKNLYKRILEKTQNTSLFQEKVEKTLDQNIRRLDSLARLLHGNETCVAVSIFKGRLLIAGNYQHGSAALQESINNVLSFFKEYTKCQQDEKRDMVVNFCEQLVNSFSTDRNIEFISRDNKKSQAAKEVVEKITSNGILKSFLHDYYLNFVSSRDSGNEAEESHKIEKFIEEWLRKKDINDEQNYIKRTLIVAARYLKDIVKLTESPDFLSRLIKLLDGKDLVVPKPGDKGVHAEMRILEEIYDHFQKPENGGKPPINQQIPYIGISRYCCPMCNLALSSHSTMNTKPYSRGVHKSLSSPWKLNEAFWDNNAFLVKFFGEELCGARIEDIKKHKVIYKNILNEMKTIDEATEEDTILAPVPIRTVMGLDDYDRIYKKAKHRGDEFPESATPRSRPYEKRVSNYYTDGPDSDFSSPESPTIGSYVEFTTFDDDLISSKVDIMTCEPISEQSKSSSSTIASSSQLPPIVKHEQTDLICSRRNDSPISKGKIDVAKSQDCTQRTESKTLSRSY